jgi:hypothetical protein
VISPAELPGALPALFAPRLSFQEKIGKQFLLRIDGIFGEVGYPGLT